VNRCSNPVLASWSPISFPTIHLCPSTHISWTLLCLASCVRDWWQSQTSFEVIVKCFYCCLTDWQNVDVPIFIVPI
jgi:hypothetical protein